MMYSFTIHGDTPSKKNSNKVHCRFKFPKTYKTKNYQDWHEKALSDLTESPVTHETIEKVHSIVLTFFYRTKRKKDLTNSAESIMDLLVEARILSDDNWSVVPEITIRFGGIDKNPRCEIEIL